MKTQDGHWDFPHKVEPTTRIIRVHHRNDGLTSIFYPSGRWVTETSDAADRLLEIFFLANPDAKLRLK